MDVMNTKKIMPIVLLTALMLGGCKKPADDTTSDPSEDIITTPSEDIDDTPSEDTTGEVDHKAPYVVEVPSGAVTRNFNENFDLMVDDFSTETLQGTLEGVENEGVLRVLVDSDNEDFPGSDDASIYKIASPVMAGAHPEVIGFRMRKVGEGNLKTENLVLGIRGDDAFKVYPISFRDAFDSDGEPLSELTEEWQEIEMDFATTIEDDTTVYETNEGTPSDVKVLETMVGFHLYAESGVELSQEIEIAEVYTKIGTTKTVVDDFNHPLKNKNTSGYDYWWCDSTGFIIQKGVNVENGSYTVDLPAGFEAFENVVIDMNGDNSGLLVNEKEALDLEGEAIKEAINGAYIPYVINLEASEIELTDKLVISSTTSLNIARIFLTNLQEKEALSEYPVIDIENRVIFDSFNRTQASFTGDWDEASTADYTPDEISVALSYHNGDKASVHDGYLEIAEVADDYVNVKEASPAAQSGLPYLVIVASGSLEGMRLGSSEVVYYHDWLAGPGLKSIPENLETYPYKTGEFVHYIIDLKESGSDIGKDDFIDIYFDNPVKIDSIYFADVAANCVTTEKAVLGAGLDLADYAYVGWVYVGDAYKVTLTFEGTGNLKSFRFGNDDGEFWFKDSKVIGMDGNPIDATLEFTEEEPLTIEIDPIATGLGEGAHLHAGGFDGSTGTATVSYTRTYATPWRLVTDVELNNVAGDAEYAYLGSFHQKEVQAKILEVRLVADKEGMTLVTFRIEGSDLRFANAQGLINEEGEVIADSTEVSTDPEAPTVLRIDLEKTFGGLENSYKDDEYLHIHFGGWGESDANVTLSATAYSAFTALYEIGTY